MTAAARSAAGRARIRSRCALPPSTVSGLRYAVEALIDIEGISVTRFVSRDVVRHPLVQRIVEVFEARALTNGHDRQ